MTFDFATVDEKGARTADGDERRLRVHRDAGADVGLDMVSIPGGAFTMGSPTYEPERRANESPQHSGDARIRSSSALRRSRRRNGRPW